MDPIISLQDVGIRYERSGNIFRRKKKYTALKSVTFDIYPGETLAIVGRNGSGKSTLLRLISGIIKPDQGQLLNYGVSVSLIALQAGFDPNLNGRDNAILNGLLMGNSRRVTESRMEEIQEYSELGDFFLEPVRSYSSGMRARLGFSIAITNNPDVLLLDEVLSVGDQHFKDKAERTMVEKLQSDQTVVLVSHSRYQITRMCDRAVLLDEGVCFASGNPSEVLEIYEERVNAE